MPCQYKFTYLSPGETFAYTREYFFSSHTYYCGVKLHDTILLIHIMKNTHPHQYKIDTTINTKYTPQSMQNTHHHQYKIHTPINTKYTPPSIQNTHHHQYKIHTHINTKYTPPSIQNTSPINTKYTPPSIQNTHHHQYKHAKTVLAEGVYDTADRMAQVRYHLLQLSPINCRWRICEIMMHPYWEIILINMVK